jgi:hypothetical protein
LVVAVVTAVVPEAGDTAITSGTNNQRLTFMTETSVGELPTAEPDN